jgi:hypothetical protein
MEIPLRIHLVVVGNYFIKKDITPNIIVAIPAAISAGTNFVREYCITGRSRMVQSVTELSLNGEAKAPNVPLAKTAPMTSRILLPAW